jgi:4'-phosphopantetheinyl transferase
MAIAYRKQVDANTEFALWRIEEEADALYKQLQLNEQEKAYVEQLANGKRHLHWLATRVLLRTMLDTSEYIDCKIDSHGKPYLVNLPYHISLSHSFNYAAVMISKSRPVGIDIEQIKQKVERIAPKFLTPAERATISIDNKIEHLYVCWCAKEAVYKCYGQKEVSFLDNLALLPFNFATEGSLDVNLHKGEVNLDYKVEYLQYEDYMLGYVKG